MWQICWSSIKIMCGVSPSIPTVLLSCRRLARFASQTNYKDDTPTSSSSDQHAFVNHSFAAPSPCRHISLLGCLYKRIPGECHPVLCQALPFGPVGNAVRYHSNRPEIFSGGIIIAMIRCTSIACMLSHVLTIDCHRVSLTPRLCRLCKPD